LPQELGQGHDLLAQQPIILGHGLRSTVRLRMGGEIVGFGAVAL
jgi:hypothetical protein